MCITASLNILNLPSVLSYWLSAGTVMGERKAPFGLETDTLLSGAPVRPNWVLLFWLAFSGGGGGAEGGTKPGAGTHARQQSMYARARHLPGVGWSIWNLNP